MSEEATYLDVADKELLAEHFGDSDFHDYDMFYRKSEDEDGFRTIYFEGDYPTNLNVILGDGTPHYRFEWPEAN
ncbi:hypothetical protein [Sphingobium sp. KCTC 72723]|uniref:hypothetical protein n=1 Tax=Sphingobium sp. KCTC 72723 TaxID=2733867 RepID=UPI00165E4C0E|nr:hypothetical protein [Sphingobium sp. KCTC 72723]